VSAAWVACAVRARSIARRRLGPAAARSVAVSGSLDAAVALLADSPYGHDVSVGSSLVDAEHAVAATTLWHLRVLAGWAPLGSAETARALAGWFEIANVDERLNELAGRSSVPAYRLGSLATAWPRLARAASAADVRRVLAASAWGDPGGADRRAIGVGMRLSWAARVADRVPGAHRLAAGHAAIVVARELLLVGGAPPGDAARLVRPVLGAGWTRAGSVAGLRARLPKSAGWALDGVERPEDLWQAEVRWWKTLDADGMALLHRSGWGPGPFVGVVAALAADARRVTAALEVAARGASPAAVEAFDALA
jgi:hypothetical protein